MENKHETGAVIRPENRIWMVVLVMLLAWGSLLFFPETRALSRTPDLKMELIDRGVGDSTGSSEIQIITGVLNDGDTATSILGPYLPLQTIYGLERKSRSLFSFNRFRSGRPFQISLDQDGFVAFEYEIDDQDRLVIQKHSDRFEVTRIPIRFEIREQAFSVEIETSLSAALTHAGHCPSLGWELAEIFAWDIDFAKDIQSGDRFQVLVEKRFRHGEYKGYGQILAAEIVNRGKTYRAFRYTDAQGRDGYYDENGRSLQKSFLKSPVKYSKITSHFSDSRFHPILKTHRPHFGVDYSAPRNTPIKTVADGVIKEMGNNNTMGRHMTIEHFNGYETSYYHMNSFAKGMKTGGSVSQGDVIGYVGKTGLATGYHLCFRMTRNGRHVNPLDAPETSARPVASREMEQFADLVAQFSEKLVTAGSIARSTP